MNEATTPETGAELREALDKCDAMLAHNAHPHGRAPARTVQGVGSSGLGDK
jgi:hypothetical protein